ncbi:MAG: pilus assembly protein PilC [Lentisphaerae bacterium RIFOXYC12_FULL_60_16]|nr:MAG: pilus assembly protein PilC [Lentisphaerae bacterium RIFOXYC12_FULL_60_16]OGV85008.1 MAG: pilus assembly protein PilC [Lentisphaerae bacterium RIFOXYB12_FULL_60_10]
MPRFKYVAMDSKGAETQGVLDAENQSQAISIIRSKGFFPTKVSDMGGAASATAASADSKAKSVSASVSRQGKGGNKLLHMFGGTVKPKNLMVFTRQLATLIDAGLPLLKGLRILLKQEKNAALREALNGMGESVEGGGTFSEALGQYPKIFDKLFVNMVRAGEAGGVLEVVLQRLAEFMEKAERIKNRIKSAMIYPVVVLVAAIGILVFLLVNVIPKFAEIFKDLLGGQSLPALTQFVINMSDAIKNRWLVILIVIGAGVVGFNLAKQTTKGRMLMDRFKLHVPIFGDLFRKTAVGRFTRTLGTLMTSGVPVLQALNIVRDTAGNDVIARAIQVVHDAVKEGDSMAAPLGSTGVFPDMVVSMVDVGEETGALPEMLMKVADNYDDEVDTAVEGLTSVIEPIMIVLLAVIIGTIVISMFVPLISIIGQMSQ